MKLILTTISIALLAIFIFAVAEAGIIYVPSQYPGIQQGINASSPGDTVLVDIGYYCENITISNNPLTLAGMFIMTGDTAAISNTIIDGLDITTTITIQPYDHFPVEVIGFTIINGFGTGNWPYGHGGGIHTGDSVLVNIDHCYIHDNLTVGAGNRGAGIYINSSYSRISNCVFYDNEARFGPAIAVGYGTRETVIDSCVIYDNICTDTSSDYMSAISITNSYDITVSHCLIHHNNGTGVRNWGSYVTNIVNCTISGNGGYGINNTYYNADIYVQNSIVGYNTLMAMFNNYQHSAVASCEYSDMVRATGMPWFGEGCIDSDPMFADTLARDYYLLAGSPCMDTGDPESPLDPDSTLADMGAIYHDHMTNVETAPELPGDLALLRIYPNPFNAATTIEYVLTETAEVEISIYNLLGQRIETLYTGKSPAGNQSLIWNADEYPSGVYFTRLRAGDKIHSRKIIFLK
ncbi:MAG: right-handed parallel beta-helix repeat-containing protein [Candidatus Zixiibacteriota bacterium]|nr:MAG: right-handed parallel beta-helix repeat-containing protein [candidate division Zixibacteria bacterium]